MQLNISLQALFFFGGVHFQNPRKNSERYTCRPQFLSSGVISLAEQWNAYHMTSIVKYERTCQRSIKIIIIGKTLVLHKSAQEKHIFLEFFFERKLLMSSI